jgi:hypothetical protein
LLCKHLNGRIIQDVTRIVQQAILPVAGVRVECNVGHDAQCGKVFFQSGHHMRHQTLGVGRLDAIGRFKVCADDWKKRHHWDAQFNALFGHMQKQIQTDAIDAWHGFDRLASVFTFKHKHRVDEIVDTECMFAHQTAAKVCTA